MKLSRSENSAQGPATRSSQHSKRERSKGSGDNDRNDRLSDRVSNEKATAVGEDYTRCNNWKMGFGMEAEWTYTRFYEKLPHKVGAYFIYMGRKIDSHHGPPTKTQRKFLRWAQNRVINTGNPSKEFDRLGVKDPSIRRSLLEDLQQYKEPVEEAVKNPVGETAVGENVPHQHETAPTREYPPSISHAAGAGNVFTYHSTVTTGKSALSRVLWQALDDPSLPAIPFPKQDSKRWPGTTEAQEAWMRAIVEDLPLNHPGGWFYPPDGSLEITPNVRKYQLWPFFFWRPQNSVWAKLRSPENPVNALPCIRNPDHNVRRTGLVPLGPRKIVARNGAFYVLGERFRCTTCLGGEDDGNIDEDAEFPPKQTKQSLRFSSLHQAFLRKLPQDLVTQLPAFFTYRKAISIDLLMELRTVSVAGGVASFAGRILEQQQSVFLTRQAQYQHHCREWLHAKERGRISPFQMVTLPDGGFPPFGSMSQGPTDGCYGTGWNINESDRSREYLMSVYIQDFLIRQPGLAQEMGSLSGRILKADHTRPLAGKVEATAGVRWSYSVMNEFGEILTHGFTESDGDDSVRRLYLGLKARYDSLRVPYPEIVYLDKQCCGSTSTMLKGIFEGITTRLDPFHFLWRFSKACSRTTHPGHGQFMKEMAQARETGALSSDVLNSGPFQSQ